MFFTTSKKSTNPAGSGKLTLETASPKCGSSADHCIISILLFNPTLRPDKSECTEEEELYILSYRQSSKCDHATQENLSPEEQEQDAKIVYYYPPSSEPEERRSQAGLLEGLIMFTRPFVPGEQPLSSISTDKYIIVLEEVEENYWLAMTFSANSLSCFNAVEPSLATAEKKRVDEDTQEGILLGVLRSFYALFRLLHGRIGLLLETGQSQQLQDILSDFSPAFLDTIDRRRLSLFHSISGYHFGPVDRLPYLSVPTLISLLQQAFPCIRHAALLINGCLVFHSMNAPIARRHFSGRQEFVELYSGLEYENDLLSLLHNYLVNSEGPASVDMHKLIKPPYGRVPTAAARPGGGCSSFGRAITSGQPSFVFGPVGQFAFLPMVHMANDTTGGVLAIVHEHLLLALILEESDEHAADTAFLQQVRWMAVEGPCGLRELNTVLSEEFKKVMRQEDTYRFVYFNHANRAVRISNRSCPLNAPSPPYIKNFCMSYQEVQRIGHMHCRFLGWNETLATRNCGSNGVSRPVTPGLSTDGDESSKSQADHDEDSKGVLQITEGPIKDPKEWHQVRARGANVIGGFRTIAVKDAHSGWLVGRRSCDREYYLALDDPKTTFTKAMEDTNRFCALHFSNIFV